MQRQSIIYLLASILVVVFAKYAHVLIVYIDMFYIWLNWTAAPLFKQIGIGDGITKIIILVLTPILIAAVPALIYRVVKGQNMPGMIELTWCLWLVIVLSNILIR